MTINLSPKITNIRVNKRVNESVKLTNKLITKSHARTKRYDIKDSVVTGLRLRISPSGSKRFVAVGRVRKANKVRTLTIGDANLVCIDEARKAAIAYLAQLQVGIDVNEEIAKEAETKQRQQTTLNEAMELYVKDRALRPKTINGYRYEIPKYCHSFIHKPVNEITEDDVCKWYLSNNHIPTSIDKAFRSLRAILEYMVGVRVIDRNPCSAVTARKLRYKIKARTRRIESHNLTKFIDSWLDLLVKGNLSTVQGDFILWLLMTGCRLDEARTMKWADLDNSQLTITIEHTKNGTPHVLPLTPLMSDLLDRRLQNNPTNNPYIFPAKQGKGYSSTKHLSDCRKALDKITEQACIPNVRPHDLRRTFTTILDELNISEGNIKSLLNHNDGTVTRKHYLQTTNTELKRKNLWAVGLHIEKSVSVKGVDSNTNKTCLYACAGAIREFIYQTTVCDYSEIKKELSAYSVLESMR
jgi:integrase